MMKYEGCPFPQCDIEEKHGHNSDGLTTFPDGGFFDQRGVYYGPEVWS